MLIKHGNFLIPLVMKGILIKDAIEGAYVIVISISNWEFTARNIDVMCFLLISSLQNGWSIWHRCFRFYWTISTKSCVESCGLNCLSSLRSVGTYFICPGWLAKLFDIPHTHHTIIGERNNIICNLSADNIQRTDWVFVTFCGNSWTLNRCRFCS